MPVFIKQSLFKSPRLSFTALVLTYTTSLGRLAVRLWDPYWQLTATYDPRRQRISNANVPWAEATQTPDNRRRRATPGGNVLAKASVLVGLSEPPKPPDNWRRHATPSGNVLAKPNVTEGLILPFPGGYYHLSRSSDVSPGISMRTGYHSDGSLISSTSAW